MAKSMKLHCVILAFACMASAAALAIAETPKSVSVPAGDMVDALESLAKQCGVDIIYPSSQLKGLKTQGVNGTLEPMTAFKTLLAGTPLMLREAGGALLITRAASVASWASEQGSADPLAEVEIEAQYEKLSVMRAEIAKLQSQFNAEYNRLNTDHQYDVVCRMETRLNSHVLSRVCQPAFVTKATEDEARGLLDGQYARPAAQVIQEKTPDYQKNMARLVEKHPELFKLVKERVELMQRYEAVRRQKLKEKRIVWD